MPRRMQEGSGGIVFHVMNRAARRMPIFRAPADYRAFEELMVDTLPGDPMRILSYVIMPNHFHLVLWPEGDRDLSRFMQRVTRSHVQRWQLAHRSVGSGTLYQGRFKAIPVQNDHHFLTVCRYVEQNPLRARLVSRATDWRWGSAWTGKVVDVRPALTDWPVERPANWTEIIDGRIDLSDELQDRIRRSVPFGDDRWASDTASRLRLLAGLRGRGRPPKGEIDSGGISLFANA